MTSELAALAAAILVQVATLVIFAVAANLELGTRATLSPRDGGLPPLSIRTARLQRTTQNGLENLILFAPAVTLVTLTGSASPLTALAAWAYVAARILYVPAYAFGWVPARSLIWTLGLLATLTLVGASLF